MSVTTRSYTFQVFTFGTSIPRNLNRLIDLKQSVTLTGLGTVGFDDAVCGMQTIYQVFSNHVELEAISEHGPQAETGKT